MYIKQYIIFEQQKKYYAINIYLETSVFRTVLVIRYCNDINSVIVTSNLITKTFINIYIVKCIKQLVRCELLYNFVQVK